MMHRTYSPFALVLTLLGILALPALAQAQTVSQQIEVLGWSATGNEIISQVTVGASGLDPQGEPVDWEYTVLEITSTRTGKVLGRYRYGVPRGAQQKAWLDAKGQDEARKRMEVLGVIKSTRGAISSNGDFVLLAHTNDFPQKMEKITADCPGCNECTSTIQLHMVDRKGAKVYKLKTHQRTGLPYSPGAEDACPQLGTQIQWHPQANRFAVIYTEQLNATAAPIHRMRVYDATQDSAGWESVAIPKTQEPTTAERLESQIKNMKEIMANATDPLDQAIVMARLGDLNRRLGRNDDAQGYYEASLDFDKKNTRSIIGLATLAYQSGDARKAKRLIRKAENMDRRIGLHHADFGLYYMLTGDSKKSQKYFDKAAEAGELSFETRLNIGEQLMASDHNLGVEYLGQALDMAPSGDDALKKELLRVRIMLIEESIRVGDLATAGRHLQALDKTTPKAVHFALLIATLSADDPSRLQLIIQKTGNALEENPQSCSLYYVRGLAFKKARRFQDALTYMGAAVACQNNMLQAQYELAGLYRDAGQLKASMAAYERFLELAPARPGDRLRTWRRQEARRLLSRLSHSGVIMLKVDCTPANGELVCKGIVQNTSGTPKGPIEIDLTTYSEGRNAGAILRETGTMSEIGAGASVDFKLTIPISEAAARATLTLGTNDAEKEMNTTNVALNN